MYKVVNKENLPEELQSSFEGHAVCLGQYHNADVYTYIYEDNSLEIGYPPIFFKIGNKFFNKTFTSEGKKAIELLMSDEV